MHFCLYLETAKDYLVLFQYSGWVLYTRYIQRGDFLTLQGWVLLFNFLFTTDQDMLSSVQVSR